MWHTGLLASQRVPPALAGAFLTTGPPAKSQQIFFKVAFTQRSHLLILNPLIVVGSPFPLTSKSSLLHFGNPCGHFSHSSLAVKQFLGGLAPSQGNTHRKALLPVLAFPSPTPMDEIGICQYPFSRALSWNPQIQALSFKKQASVEESI